MSGKLYLIGYEYVLCNKSVRIWMSATDWVRSKVNNSPHGRFVWTVKSWRWLGNLSQAFLMLFGKIVIGTQEHKRSVACQWNATRQLKEDIDYLWSSDILEKTFSRLCIVYGDWSTLDLPDFYLHICWLLGVKNSELNLSDSAWL